MRFSKRKVSIIVFLFSALLIFQGAVLPVYGSSTFGNLTGRVLNKETKKPLANIIVIAKKDDLTFTTTTDDDGYFSFLDLEPGTYKLIFERVGYHTSVMTGIPVSAGTTSYESFKLTPAIYRVKGLTVVASRSMIVNPRETMTFYGFRAPELTHLLPGPASLNTPTVLEDLPGVQTYHALGGYTLSMPAGPHVWGGTGFGTVYSLDGIPLTNDTLFGDPGNLGLTTGLSDFQFYPGVYPVQYGNGMDGYQNNVVPEGFGKLHGHLQFSYGFWTDPGENSPVFAADPLTGEIGGVIGESSIRPSNPDYWNLELAGQSGKFHYFFNTVAQDGGESAYSNPALEAAITYSGVGGTIYQKAARDNLLKLNYDLDLNNELELLLADGFNETTSEFINNSGTEATFAPVPPFNYSSYNIESLGYLHHFSPMSALTFRLWEYNSNPDFYTPTAADGYFLQNDTADQKGVRIEYKQQINSQNKITIGGQYIYTNDYQYMGAVLPNPLFLLTGKADFAGANNQNPSAWLNEDWTPTSKWDINMGVRWDKMIYQAPAVPDLLLQPNGLPYVLENFGGFSPDNEINNPNDLQGLFTSCTPQYNTCINSGILSPSFIQPRISASYRITNNLTAKAGFGEFNTFAFDMQAFAAANLCSSGTGILFGTPCKVIGNVGYTTAGNEPEYGNQYEFSLEYSPSPGSFIKITPYYKKVFNPITYSYVPFAAAGGFFNANSLSADGVQLEMHTQNWHGLTGTLNYTYNNSTIAGNPEYSLFLLPQFVANSPITGAAVIGPNALPNSSSLFNQIDSEEIPTDWNIKHTVNLLLDYKPNKRWEIAPNFTFTSGQPYGMGSSQLKSFYVNMAAACGSLPNPNDPYLTPATCAEDLPANGDFNPLGETLPNSLTGPSAFLANLAITYHASKWFSTTFSVFNLFNNGQILAYNSTPYFPTFMGSFGYPFAQDDSPLKGGYSPLALQPIREYFVTTTFKF